MKEGGGKRGGHSGERKGDTQKDTKMPIFMGKTFYEKQSKERTPHPPKKQKGKTNKNMKQRPTKKQLMKQSIVIECFDVVFMNPKQRRNQNIFKKPFTICPSQFFLKKQPPS